MTGELLLLLTVAVTFTGFGWYGRGRGIGVLQDDLLADQATLDTQRTELETIQADLERHCKSLRCSKCGHEWAAEMPTISQGGSS